MAMPRLRFYARGTAQVTDPHAQERGTRRCIARRWQEVTTGRWAWVPTEKPQEVDYHHDLVKACRDGDLWPADEATAKVCGAGFDPEYGGELTETIRAYKAKKAAADAALAPVAIPTNEASVAPMTMKKHASAVAGGKGDV